MSDTPSTDAFGSVMVGPGEPELVDQWAEFARSLERALRAIVRDPHGCRFCDSGKLRTPADPNKGHDDTCGYALAAAVLEGHSARGGTFEDGMKRAASIVEDFRQSTEEGDTLDMVIAAIQAETPHRACGESKVSCVYRGGCVVGMACELEGRCMAPEVERKHGVGPHADENRELPSERKS